VIHPAKREKSVLRVYLIKSRNPAISFKNVSITYNGAHSDVLTYDETVSFMKKVFGAGLDNREKSDLWYIISTWSRTPFMKYYENLTQKCKKYRVQKMERHGVTPADINRAIRVEKVERYQRIRKSGKRIKDSGYLEWLGRQMDEERRMQQWEAKIEKFKKIRESGQNCNDKEYLKWLARRDSRKRMRRLKKYREIQRSGKKCNDKGYLKWLARKERRKKRPHPKKRTKNGPNALNFM